MFSLLSSCVSLLSFCMLDLFLFYKFWFWVTPDITHHLLLALQSLRLTSDRLQGSYWVLGLNLDQLHTREAYYLYWDLYTSIFNFYPTQFSREKSASREKQSVSLSHIYFLLRTFTHQFLAQGTCSLNSFKLLYLSILKLSLILYQEGLILIYDFILNSSMIF